MEDDKKYNDQEVLKALFLAWLLPGAGHWTLGYRSKGFVLGILIFSSYWAGIVMSGFQEVIYSQEPYILISQAFTPLLGILSFIITHFHEEYFYLEAKFIDVRHVGLLYICISSLLNALILLNIYSLSLVKRNEENDSSDQSKESFSLETREDSEK